jgi:hypothetical protein
LISYLKNLEPDYLLPTIIVTKSFPHVILGMSLFPILHF